MSTYNDIPKEIDDSECLLRSVHYPYHFKKGKITSEVFIPPSQKNEISTTRLKYSNTSFCKKLAFEIDKNDTSGQKKYKGFLQVRVGDIRRFEINSIFCQVISSPIVNQEPPKLNNPAHADIIMPFFAPQRGEKLDPNIRMKLGDLVEGICQYIPDNHLEVEEWMDEEIICP
jgi:hypothetical protein